MIMTASTFASCILTPPWYTRGAWLACECGQPIRMWVVVGQDELAPGLHVYEFSPTDLLECIRCGATVTRADFEGEKNFDGERMIESPGGVQVTRWIDYRRSVRRKAA